MPLNPSMYFYKIITGDDGKQQLEAVNFPEFSPQVFEAMKYVVSGFTQHEDDALFGQIAAGRAAMLILQAKAYRPLGLTKAGFCQKVFRRAPRTVDSYVAAAASYEDIGGLDCPVQPDSVDQLDVLQKILPDIRREFWLRTAELNDGKAPSGEVLLEQAADENALISAKKSKSKPAPKKADLPCSTIMEAVDFAAAHQEQADKAGAAAWSKMREFLLSLAQQESKAVPAKTKRPAKPKTFRVGKGQLDLFEETLTPKKQSHHEQKELTLNAG